MTGDKRADYVSINPDSGSLRLWENRCWTIPAGLDDGSNYSEDDDGVDALWTWLHFQGCSKDQQKAIKTAHEDAETMADLVKSIDFANDHGAMEFLDHLRLTRTTRTASRLSSTIFPPSD
ncbi:uncharacterized protein N7496_005145 [Penicillium cataractarum]|uniref:Uncharacterized protein n=1 Tax=Penicillium cataractarum TaxID=2100454 RepID=A0A9W9SFL1_9EURO|nr:uncharacterized protein N7496_005145 [Penicillium cataractarum]KAJ5377736.1 hypothetical protein N7496_005145 [Penicillium cataractarum]